MMDKITIENLLQTTSNMQNIKPIKNPPTGGFFI